MKGKSSLAVLTALGACGVAQAQDYFDFDSIPGLPDQPSVQVDLNQAMVGMAAAAVGAEEPLVGQVLAGIEGVRVRAFPKLEDTTSVASFIADASERLETGGWERVVYAQDGESNLRIYARMMGEAMNGLTIMAVSEDGAAFVNVAGRITAEQFGRLAANLDADDVIDGIPNFGRTHANARRD